MVNFACLDVGSTFTKGLLVDATGAAVRGHAAVPTTSRTDVLDGVDEVLAALGPAAEAVACSSAGGGLRLAVVGYEQVVTAEAGRRVALSAGARVVHVATGELDRAGLRELRAAAADLLLLVGGTDGGNAEVLLHNARALAAGRWRRPVVVAGNAEARTAVVEVLRAAGCPALPAGNVLPEIGRLDPGPARAVIRRAFVEHVIGGKGLTRRPAGFRALVRAATPDAVLAGVEVLAEAAGDVLVVDVGGATTDVYSVVDADRLEAEDTGDVAGTPVALRTVEGDLGVRWSAPGVVDAAVAERLLDAAAAERLAAAAATRHDQPSLVPASAVERADDRLLARLAMTVAVRRHARGARDLRRVTLVVGSGGVLRHAGPAERASVLQPLTGDHAGGWRLPERARVVVDELSVLAPAGLLLADAPDAARVLAGSLLEQARAVS